MSGILCLRGSYFYRSKHAFYERLDFLEHKIKRGCRVRHMALMSGDIDAEVTERAKNLVIMIFEKPFATKDLEDWIETAEKDIPEQLRLFNWNID